MLKTSVEINKTNVILILFGLVLFGNNAFILLSRCSHFKLLVVWKLFHNILPPVMIYKKVKFIYILFTYAYIEYGNKKKFIKN